MEKEYEAKELIWEDLVDIRLSVVTCLLLIISSKTWYRTNWVYRRTYSSGQADEAVERLGRLISDELRVALVLLHKDVVAVAHILLQSC